MSMVPDQASVRDLESLERRMRLEFQEELRTRDRRRADRWTLAIAALPLALMLFLLGFIVGRAA
jgi:hypothetical protein